jgi:GT2 family glycosyltransferase
VVLRGDELLGSFQITNLYQPISVARLREAIVDHINVRLLAPVEQLDPWNAAVDALRSHYAPDSAPRQTASQEVLDRTVSVSIVVATYDRPDDLRRCLQSLGAQQTARPFEIVVVDNHPASGLTPPVVAAFSEVRLISETRKGLSYARNAGILASSGEIVVMTDDDVTMPLDWLERIVAPFVRDDVVIVTGNVLPYELETRAQQLFENYGGLGRGFTRREADRVWFNSFRRHAVPTWKLGATANAAFRMSIFQHPQIGLLDESLGAGSPTGCSEDTYLFYKVLKAGFTIVYEPQAYVWHRHRRDMAALRKQIYNYSKGHIAYHLTTLLNDGDLRPLPHMLVSMPVWYARKLLQQIKAQLLGRADYPISLTLTEIAGNLAGPGALVRSRKRVRELGRSGVCRSEHAMSERTNSTTR